MGMLVTLGILGTLLDWEESSWIHILFMIVLEIIMVQYIGRVGYFSDVLIISFCLFLLTNYVISTSR